MQICIVLAKKYLLEVTSTYNMAYKYVYPLAVSHKSYSPDIAFFVEQKFWNYSTFKV